MKVTYAYKTSDGVRHEEAMEASSREKVFEELRSRGIRAIKVVAGDGSKANGETRSATGKRVVFAALAAGILAGVVVALLAPAIREDIGRIGRYKPGMAEKVAEMQAAARGLLDDHARRMGSAGVWTLTDYGGIFAATNSAMYDRAIWLGYNELDTSRRKARKLFRPLYDIFPPDCVNERMDVQKTYAEVMDEIDRSEAQLVRDEKAYALLSSNRGKWSLRDGKVTFSDGSLAKEFTFLGRGLDPVETRWSRDFKQ